MPSQDVHLYYFPGSFYSQRVCVALAEKKIKYKETGIDFTTADQLSAWYLRINPAGLVPVLKVGERIIPESEKIVEVVDTLESSQDFKLFPDVATKEGQLVSEWRKKLDAVEVEEITYSVLLHNEISPGGLNGFAKLLSRVANSREKYNDKIGKTIKHLEKTKQENPDLAECIDKLIAKQRDRVSGTRYKPDHAEDQLKQLETIMDEAEEQLKKTKAYSGKEFFLCGPTFSLADINLCTLLGRLTMLGHIDRFADPEKRPVLTEYWTVAQTRPSIKTYVTGALPRAVRLAVMKRVKWFASRAAVAGIIVAAGIFIAQKYRSS